jgi:hypothetical protein
MASLRPSPSSPFGTFHEQHLAGRLLPAGLALGALLLVLLYWVDVLPERWAGALLAAAITGGLGVLLVARLVESAPTDRAGGIAALLVVLLAASVFAPIALAAFPGAPLAAHTLQQSGEALALPAGSAGPVRLAAHVQPGEAATFDCRYGLALGNDRFDLDLGRQAQAVRMGRRGRGSVMHDTSSAFMRTEVAAGVDRVVLERAAGSPACALQLAVYRDHMPARRAWLMNSVLLGLVAGLAWRYRADATVAVVAGAAVGFGVVTADAISPTAVVRAVIGGVLLGTPIGALGTGLIWWLAGKLTGRSARRRR